MKTGMSVAGEPPRSMLGGRRPAPEPASKLAAKRNQIGLLTKQRRLGTRFLVPEGPPMHGIDAPHGLLPLLEAKFMIGRKEQQVAAAASSQNLEPPDVVC